MTVISVTRRLSVEPLLDITDPDFAHWYELGVFWAMYGDCQGNGPYEDRYLIENISRNLTAGRYDSLSSPWFSSVGFYLGMLHGGSLTPRTNQLRSSETLVVLTDPAFTAGYHHGRRDTQHITARTLMRTIHQWALSRVAGQTFAYELGTLAGNLSCALIPVRCATTV